MSDVLTPAGTGVANSSAADDSNYLPANASTNFMDQQSNAIMGANLAAQEQGSKSLLDTAGDIATKGIPATGMAIMNSFYNTAVEVGNFFGGDAHKASIEDEFGPDSDTTAYYQQHAGVIEGAALAVGSLAPGLGATKLLKLAQVGKFGTAMQVSTGLFSGIRDGAVAAATEDLAGNMTGQSLFGLTALNKTKAILAGIGDQALQGAVYETATLATMHASPITDANTMSDNISDVIDSAKGFGVVGGLIDGAINFSKINKAIKLADLSTKDQEAFGSRGLGNITPGDRMVNLYSTLDSIPTPANRLETMKLGTTTTTTGRLIQEQMIKAAGGDEELAGAMRGFIEKGREDGSITGTELQNNLGQLSKIGRHGDTSVVSQPSDVFYINGKIDPASVGTATHDDLLSKIATGNASTSKAFSLTSPTTLPVIGRATDTSAFPALEGSASIGYSQYAGAMDAYKKGVDIYVDAKGVTHINPKSTAFGEVVRPGESRILTAAERTIYQKTGNLPADSKPLNAVGLTLDVTNGKLFGESPLPVVGDIGKPTVTPNGLSVGHTNYPQVAGQEFAPVSPLDANSRYVWAALRGSRASDSIHPTDLPMMEQVYREKVAGFNHETLVNFSDGSSFPQDASSLLKHIADVKQTQYGDLLQQGKNADEIGHILNAPTSGLTKNFNTLDPQELMVAPEVNANIKHVRLAYDIGTTKDSEGNLLRGTQATSYRTKLATDTNSNTVANYLAKTVGIGDSTGALADTNFRALQFTKGAGDADILGAGSGFLSNSNGAYGTIQQQAERIGKTVSQLSTLRRSVVADTLGNSADALRRDPEAAAEYGNFVSVRHSTGENYVMLSDADAAANKLPANTAILEGALKKDPKTGAVTVDPTYVPKGFQPGSIGTQAGQTVKGLQTFYTLSPKVAALEKASRDLNAARGSLRSDWWKSAGTPKEAYNPDILYAPPINTSRYPFMAYVREREGYALGESGAHIITAKNAGDLQQKIDLLGPNFDAFTKGDVANFKKAQGEFQFNRNFQSNKVGTEMARKGILNNVVPETRASTLIDHLASWHFNQEDQLLRDHVELHNAATFSQIKAMGDRFDLTGTSRFGAITPFTQSSATNPFMSYIRTALGISAKDNYPLWQLAQEKLEAFGDSAFNAVRSAFGAVQKGLLPVEQAAKISEKMGLGNPYGTSLEEMSKTYYGGLANQLPDPGIFRKFVATANATLGATVIRLDTFQQIIHAVTLPIMTALEHGSATADLQDLMKVTVPGTATPLGTPMADGLQVPTFTKSLFNAVKNYFGDSDGKLLDMYHAAGMTKDELQVHRQMINSLSMPLGKLSDLGWAQKIDSASQYAEKLTGTKFTNKFIHFIASDVGRQLGEAQGQSGQDLLDTIGTFSGRVLGNFAAGQRAGIFSGPVGQAVGLFQSYQWNMMQQLLRHIGDGDVKALAMGAGMQASIFGLSSLPGFSALNSMIADRHGNTQGQDLYSGAANILGSETSNYLLYGSLSGLTGLSLYSRGDLNPRRASILPINPLQIPSVAAGMRVYQTLAQLENNVTTKGGNIPASLLIAAEHNGLSRPLAGLAELVQGFSTNPQGALVATNSGFGDLSNISTMSRILGAKPIEESVALDALYRSNALQVLDNSRLNQLGQAAKTALYGNSPVAPQDVQAFMSDYVKAGGNQTNFNKWFLNEAKSANVSAVNKTMMNFNSPRSQSLQLQMGGVPLPDYRNNGSVGVAQPAVAPLTTPTQ